MFRFGLEQILILYLLVPLLGLFFWYAFRQRKKALHRFGHSGLVRKLACTVSRRGQGWKVVLTLSAVAFLVTALARPQFGTRLETVRREGQDIVVALDLSLSMLAEDIAPNRLEKAKHAIGSLIDRLEGDRIGLVAFAGEAFIQCPLTLDYGAAKMFLNSMEPDLVPVPGTAIGEAIDKSLSAFVAGEAKHKVLILITDGEDHPGEPLEAAEEASDQGVVIFTVGIGSPQGVPIPVIDQRGQRTGFKLDSGGEVVLTRLDEQTLQQIASAAKGRYFRATPGEDELDHIVEEVAAMDKKELAAQDIAQYEEQYQGFLAVALLLLAAEFFIPERRKLKGVWKGRFE